MSGETNQKNVQQNEDSSGQNSNENNKESNDEKKALTFKDWKNLKDSQEKPNEKTGKSKSNKTKNNNRNNNGRNNFNNGFNGPNQSFNVGNNRMAGFMPNNNYNGMNNYGNNYGYNNQNSYGFNNYYGPDNYSRSNNVINNNFNSVGFNNSRGMNNFKGTNNIELPDNFFASDGIYRQKDLMQKPLPPSCNPFRDEEKAKQLLNEFDRSRYSKEDKKKKKKSTNTTNKSANTTTKNQNQQITNTNTNDNNMINNEPKVYVPNPKAKVDGKAFIPKPKLPDQNLEISRDEKKQQWREYRQAMKPFKNREFYNAKRVVQRLGKKDPSELNEKELFRLTNAREIMAAHKARLVAKYGTYVKAESESNEMGELYVLNKPPPPPPPQSVPKTNNTYYAKPSSKDFQNYGNFVGADTCYYNANRDQESGRKILGGYSSGYPGFVSGGLLEGTAARLYSQ